VADPTKRLSQVATETFPVEADSLLLVKSAGGFARRLTGLPARRLVAPHQKIEVDYTLGSGSTDAFSAIQAAIDEVADGGEVYLPPAASVYRVSSNLSIDKPIIFSGAGLFASYIQFDQGAGFRVSSGAARYEQRGIRADGVRVDHPDFPLDADVSVGQRFRSKLEAIGSQGDNGSFPAREADFGLHVLCTQSGHTSATHPAWASDAGATFTSGTAEFVVEDWSILTIKTTFVSIHHCAFNFATDCPIFVRGDGTSSVSDGVSISHCQIAWANGHGIYCVGADAQLSYFEHNEIGELSRGAGIYDSGFFNSHGVLNQVTVARWPYVTTGQVAATKWDNNYFEACETGIWIGPSAKWSGGWPPLLSSPSTEDPRSKGVADDNLFRRGGVVYLDSNDPPFRHGIGERSSIQSVESWFRDGDHFGGVSSWVLGDSEDPDGFLRFAWDGLAADVMEEMTGGRSIFGPYRRRYPQGFLLGRTESGRRQTLVTNLDHPPDSSDINLTRQNLYRPGDLIINTETGPTDVFAWKANKKGGWGGGRQYNGGRIWIAATGDIAIGEGIEPSTPNGKVFRLSRFELETSPGVWARASIYKCTLSSTEPTWDPVDGHETTEQLPLGSIVAGETHRIVWECYADVGMTNGWSTYAARTGTVST